MVEKLKNKITSQVYCNDIELILNKIALDMGCNRNQIREVLDAQFRTLSTTIKSGGIISKDSNYSDFASLRLIRLGSFRPSPKKFEYIKNSAIKKELDV